MLHDDFLVTAIAQATMSDPFTIDIMARINDPSQEMQSSNLSHFTIRDGILYRNHLLYVPVGACCTRVLQNCHDDPLVSHFRAAKTLELLSWGFWWPQPWKFVKECNNQDVWHLCPLKATHHHPYSLLHPLRLPS